MAFPAWSGLPSPTRRATSAVAAVLRPMAVSYTHLDVYKRQILGSEQITRTIEQYVFSFAELTALMGEAGLTVTETFGSLDGEPYALGDEQAYLLAVKK